MLCDVRAAVHIVCVCAVSARLCVGCCMWWCFVCWCVWCVVCVVWGVLGGCVLVFVARRCLSCDGIVVLVLCGVRVLLRVLVCCRGSACSAVWRSVLQRVVVCSCVLPGVLVCGCVLACGLLCGVARWCVGASCRVHCKLFRVAMSRYLPLRVGV